MSRNQNLLAYFSSKPRSTESQIGHRRPRLPDVSSGGSEVSPASKRQKNEEDAKELDASASKSTLSPEQKQMIESKRQQALEKLKQKKSNGLSRLIGDSWFNKLEAEFSKDYFKKVRSLRFYLHTIDPVL